MIGILRHGLQLGAVMLIALSLRLWQVQPTPDTCDALGLVQDFYGDWSAVSVDGQALWRIQPDGGGLLAAFPDWLILSGQGTPLRVRPDGSHVRPLFAPPTAYPYLDVLAWSDDGQRLWFGQQGDGYTLYEADVLTRNVQAITTLGNTLIIENEQGQRFLHVFSPEHLKGDWYRIIPTNPPIERLTFSPNRLDDHLRYAPDDEWLLYDAPNGDSVTLYRQPMAGGDEEALLTGPDGFIVVGWSPDGKRLAVWSAGRAVTLHVMDWPDGVWRTFDATGYSRDLVGWADNRTVLLPNYGDGDSGGHLDLLNTEDGSIRPLLERYHYLEVLPTTPPRLAYSVVEDNAHHLYTRTLPDGPPVYQATFTDQVVSMQPSPCGEAALVETYAGLYLLRADGVAQKLRFAVVANGWLPAMPPHDWHPLALMVGGVVMGIMGLRRRGRL